MATEEPRGVHSRRQFMGFAATVALGTARGVNERCLTSGPMQKDLDDNINFSPDGRWLTFDCRDAGGIGGCTRIGVADAASGRCEILLEQRGAQRGLGAASFVGAHEVVAISALPSGLPYDFTVRGGILVAADRSGRTSWLDSRSVQPPFVAGALRGGTHKHEPDRSGNWIGFTYNDAVTKAAGSDLRNVGVCRRGHPVPVPHAADGSSCEGTAFAVLLTAAVDKPDPGSDAFSRAEMDCWVGASDSGPAGRARAFIGHVLARDGAPATDLFIVTIPMDITTPGPLGPLEGTARDYPKPPAGARVRRLTHYALESGARRVVIGHPRANDAGTSIAFATKDAGDRVELNLLDVKTGITTRVATAPGAQSYRLSPDGGWIVAALADGRVQGFSTVEPGRVAPLGGPGTPASNVVVAPDGSLVAWNRQVDGVSQIFTAPLIPD